VGKHKPYDPGYAEYLLFLLNTDPTTYGARTTVDDWMWYRDEAVTRVQYYTVNRRFPVLPPAHERPGLTVRRAEWEAANRRPNATNCGGQAPSLDPHARLFVAIASDFFRWLHDLAAEDRIEDLRCCRVCGHFRYVEHRRELGCPEAPPTKKPPSYYRIRRTNPAIQHREKISRYHRDEAKADRATSKKAKSRN
jgi:hypothetical protein